MTLTQREKFLLAIALLVVVAMSYYFFRWRRQQQIITGLRNETHEAQADLQKRQQEFTKTDRLPLAAVDVRALESELSKLEEQLSQRQSRLTELRGQFASVTNNQALQQLKVDISTLASASDVTVLESIPLKAAPESPAKGSKANVATPSTAGPFVSRASFNEMNGGKFYEITLQSSFHSLHRFLRGLSQLSWKVTVVHFDIKIDEHNEKRGEQPLKTKLVLAL